MNGRFTSRWAIAAVVIVSLGLAACTSSTPDSEVVGVEETPDKTPEPVGLTVTASPAAGSPAFSFFMTEEQIRRLKEAAPTYTASDCPDLAEDLIKANADELRTDDLAYQQILRILQDDLKNVMRELDCASSFTEGNVG